MPKGWGGEQLKSPRLQNAKYKEQNAKQMAAHRISMLYCDISKERDPWESKMQNAKCKKQERRVMLCLWQREGPQGQRPLLLDKH